MTPRILMLVTLLAGASAHADAARPFAAPAVINTVAPAGVGSLGQVTLALALVLAAIFAAAWLLRRMRGFGKPSGATLDVLANLPVGPKERALLIRVGSTQILIGVAPGRVTTLHVLTEPVDTAPAASAPTTARPNFRALLLRSLGKS